MEGWKEEEPHVTLVEMRKQRTGLIDAAAAAAIDEAVRNDDDGVQFHISYEVEEKEEESKEEVVKVEVEEEKVMQQQQQQHRLVVETSSHTKILSSIDIVQGNVQSPSVSSGLVSDRPSSYVMTKEGSQAFPDISDDDREKLLKPDIVMEEAENDMEYAVACATETEIADREQTHDQLRNVDTEPWAPDAMPKSLESNASSPSIIIDGDKKIFNGLDSDAEERHFINGKLQFGSCEESSHISAGMTVTEGSSKISAKDETLPITREIPKSQEPSESIHNGHAVEATVEYITEDVNDAGRGLVLVDEPKPAVEVLSQHELHPSARSQDAELFSLDELVRGENVEEEAGKRIDTEPTEEAAKSLEAHHMDIDVTAEVPTVAELLSKSQPETEISEQDVQGIKGRKVWKRFGRKKYLGDVVGYDEENKWFKVAYEDGDEEELDIGEIREILLPPGTLPKSVIKRRMIHPVEGSADRQRKSSRKRGRPPKQLQATGWTSSEMRKPERVVKRTYKRRKRQAQAQPTEEEESKEKSSTTQSTMTGNEASDSGGEGEEEVGGKNMNANGGGGGAVDVEVNKWNHERVQSKSSQSKRRGQRKKTELQSDAELSTGSKPPQVEEAIRRGEREIQHPPDAERSGVEVEATTSIKPPGLAMADHHEDAVRRVVTTTTTTTTLLHDDEQEKKSMSQMQVQVQEEEDGVRSATAVEMQKRRRERSETEISIFQNDANQEQQQEDVRRNEMGREQEKLKSQEEISGEQSMVQLPNVRPAGMDITTSNKEEENRVLIGKKMQKHYKGALRSGRVTERLLNRGGVDTKFYYYKVKYEHGDEEELDAKELHAVLVD